MVDLALLQSVSYIAGALGVCVATIYYVMNLRMTQKKAKVDAAILYGNLITDKNKVLEWRHFLYETKFSSFAEWEEKYRSDPESYASMYSAGGTLIQLGLLLKEDVVDSDMLMKMVSPTWVKTIGGKILPLIKGMREVFNDPFYGYYAEFLINEVERRYPIVKVPERRYTSP
jgi:hypothetical protein